MLLEIGTPEIGTPEVVYVVGECTYGTGEFFTGITLTNTPEVVTRTLTFLHRNTTGTMYRVVETPPDMPLATI